jgi:hypothetical protein
LNRSELQITFVDLGMSPHCQTHIQPHELDSMERFYPLHAWVCEKCYLVQLEEYVAPQEILSDYAYFPPFPIVGSSMHVAVPYRTRVQPRHHDGIPASPATD